MTEPKTINDDVEEIDRVVPAPNWAVSLPLISSAIIPLPKALKGRYASIAADAGLTRPHVSRVLRGETRDPSADVVRKIARSMAKLLELNISTDDLLDYLEVRQGEARERREKDDRPHVEKVRKLKRLGKTMRQIEEETGINRTTASGII